nr:hypothetical protein [Azoarcus sp. TTM-91]
MQRADALLGQADALLNRHRGETATPADDDLPILTDVVDEDELPPEALLPPKRAPLPGVAPSVAPAPLPPQPPVQPAQAFSAPAPTPSAAPATLNPRQVEQLVRLDTEISREVEAWLANELPQILSRELDSLAERVRTQTLAHLRATLLPALSERIARRLDGSEE